MPSQHILLILLAGSSYSFTLALLMDFPPFSRSGKGLDTSGFSGLENTEKHFARP